MSALKLALSQVLKGNQKKEAVKKEPVINFEPKKKDSQNQKSNLPRANQSNQPRRDEHKLKIQSNPNEVSPEVLKAILHGGDDSKV